MRSSAVHFSFTLTPNNSAASARNARMAWLRVSLCSSVDLFHRLVVPAAGFRLVPVSFLLRQSFSFASFQWAKDITIHWPQSPRLACSLQDFSRASMLAFQFPARYWTHPRYCQARARLRGEFDGLLA